MKSHRLPDVICPDCEHPLNAATNADGTDEPPEKGAITICFNCEALLKFTSELTIAKLDWKEFAAFDHENKEMISQAMAALRRTKRGKHD